MNFVYLKCNVFISLTLFWDRHWHFPTKNLHCRYLCAIKLLLQNDLINKTQSFGWFFIFFWRFILVFSFQDFGDFGLFVYCSSFASLVAALNSFPTDTNNVKRLGFRILSLYFLEEMQQVFSLRFTKRLLTTILFFQICIIST